MSNIVLNNGDGVTVLDSTNTKAVPIDGEGRGIVNTYEDIANIRNPYLYMRVIVRNDSQDGIHLKGEYIITSLTNIGKVDASGIKSFKEYVAESDPNVPAHVKSITQENINTWNSAVPNTRKVNNKPLNSDVQLTPLDIGAQPTIDTSHKLSADNIADGSTNKVVTQTEKTTWNGKQNALNSTQLANIDKGGTALQPSSTAGLLKNDGTVDTETQGKADNAIQTPNATENNKIPVMRDGSIIWEAKPSNGLSAYEVWLDENGYDTSHDVNEFFEWLKAHISKFIYEDYDATAAGDISNIGDAVTSNNGVIGNTTPSASTKDVILLMPNNDADSGTGAADATMMFATIETSTPGEYEFVYVGSINDLDASTFVEKSQIVNDLTTSGANNVLSAEAGKEIVRFTTSGHTYSSVEINEIVTNNERHGILQTISGNWTFKNSNVYGTNHSFFIIPVIYPQNITITANINYNSKVVFLEDDYILSASDNDSINVCPEQSYYWTVKKGTTATISTLPTAKYLYIKVVDGLTSDVPNIATPTSIVASSSSKHQIDEIRNLDNKTQYVPVLEEILENNDNLINLTAELLPLAAGSSSYSTNTINRTFLITGNANVGDIYAFIIEKGTEQNLPDVFNDLGITSFALTSSTVTAENGVSWVERQVISIYNTGSSKGYLRLNESASFVYVTITVNEVYQNDINEVVRNAMKCITVVKQESYSALPHHIGFKKVSIGDEDLKYEYVKKNQGTANEGKILRINDEGMVVPTESASDNPNVISVRQTHRVYIVGNNIAEITASATYDSNHWTISGDSIVFNGTTTGETASDYPFDFGIQSENDKPYYISLTSGTATGLFRLKIGNGYDTDTYNGTSTQFGGLLADGGSLKIIPFSGNSFTITDISCKKVADSSTVGATYVDVILNNVNAGNSDNTIVSGKWNVAIGPQSSTMTKNIDGSRSIAIGFNALKNFYSGMQNIAIGTFPLAALKYGNHNVAIGCDCLWESYEAVGNVAIGKSTLSPTNHSYSLKPQENIAIGKDAIGMFSEDVNRCVAIGVNSCQRGGTNTVAIGYGTNVHNCKNSIFIGYNVTTTGAYSEKSNIIYIDNYGGGDSTHVPRPTKSNVLILGNTAHADDTYIAGKHITFEQDGSVTWEPYINSNQIV